jgi:hypothetical protein
MGACGCVHGVIDKEVRNLAGNARVRGLVFWDRITPMHQPSCSHLKRMYRSIRVEPWGCMGSRDRGSGGFWSNSKPGGGRSRIKLRSW